LPPRRFRREIRHTRARMASLLRATQLRNLSYARLRDVADRGTLSVCWQPALELPLVPARDDSLVATRLARRPLHFDATRAHDTPRRGRTTTPLTLTKPAPPPEMNPCGSSLHSCSWPSW